VRNIAFPAPTLTNQTQSSVRAIASQRRPRADEPLGEPSSAARITNLEVPRSNVAGASTPLRHVCNESDAFQATVRTRSPSRRERIRPLHEVKWRVFTKGQIHRS